MDFKRVQWLLLAIFIVFNVYLLTRLTRNTTMDRPETQSVVIVDVEQQLKERNITIQQDAIKPEISLSLLQAPTNNQLAEHVTTLTKQTYQLEYGVLKSTFDAPVPLDVWLEGSGSALANDQIEAIRQNLLHNNTLILFGAEYAHAVYYPTENVLVFQIVAQDDKPIVDGTAEIRIQLNEQYHAVSYVQTYQAGFSKLEKPIQLIKADDALQVVDNRIETYLPNDSEIVSVDLGYYRSNDLSELDIFTPVWEIQYIRRDGTLRTKLVEAIRGHVINR